MKKIIWNRILAAGMVLLGMTLCGIGVVLAGIIVKIVWLLFLLGFNRI